MQPTLQAASCLMSALHTGQLGFLARHTVMQWWQNVCPQFTCRKSVFSLTDVLIKLTVCICSH